MHDRAVTANVSIPSVGDLSSRRIFIEDVYPVVDAGRFPVKRIAGEAIEVWADIFREGHPVLAAELLWRPEAASKWSRVPMLPRQNDRWSGSFTPVKSGKMTTVKWDFDTGKLVVFYDIASGMRFLRPAMERTLLALDAPAGPDAIAQAKEIGRASCRERV